jgi:septum site-determining protein MinC
MIEATVPATAAKPANQVGSEAPFQLKGTSYKLMVLKIANPSDASFFSRLRETIAQAPNFFLQAPIVLDFGDLDPEIDLRSFVARLRDLRLLAVGVEAASAEIQRGAISLGLPVFPSGRQQPVLEPRTESKTEATRPSIEPPGRAEEREQRSSVLVTEPVRSGRQIYAARADLVVVAPVSPGAEILADGHIHVYDTMRGRALAGLNGDRTARIFCRKLEAELVSIAGLYKVSEDIDRNYWKSSVQIYLNADRLCIDRLS